MTGMRIKPLEPTECPACDNEWPAKPLCQTCEGKGWIDETTGIPCDAPEFTNWTLLDAQGRALWIVSAYSIKSALEAYSHPGNKAVTARPESPEDKALSERINESWGKLD